MLGKGTVEEGVIAGVDYAIDIGVAVESGFEEESCGVDDLAGPGGGLCSGEAERREASA